MKRHPGRRGMARLLAGRVVSTGCPPYRNPDRARLHPGKAAKKAEKRMRVKARRVVMSPARMKIEADLVAMLAKP